MKFSEGGLVFGKYACIVGILAKPLRLRVGGTKIQLVLPWGAIADGIDGQFQNQSTGFNLESFMNIATYWLSLMCLIYMHTVVTTSRQSQLLPNQGRMMQSRSGNVPDVTDPTTT